MSASRRVRLGRFLGALLVLLPLGYLGGWTVSWAQEAKRKAEAKQETAIEAPWTRRDKCAECHSERRRRGGLRVSTLEDLLTGGRSGPAIVPGDPDASLLIQVVRHEIEDMEMPQDAPALSVREIEGLAEWIENGAAWPAEAAEVVFAASERLANAARVAA